MRPALSKARISTRCNLNINIQYFRFLTVPIQCVDPVLAFLWLQSSRPRRMAWTAEQKRDRRAQRKRDRAAEDERRGVKRKPRGRPPLYHRWDGSAGAWVLDEAVETLERQQLELPPLSSRPEDLNAWASANPPPCRDDFATQELFDAAREPWYVLLMGTRLPPYGQNAKRAKA